MRWTLGVVAGAVMTLARGVGAQEWDPPPGAAEPAPEAAPPDAAPTDAAPSDAPAPSGDAPPLADAPEWDDSEVLAADEEEEAAFSDDPALDTPPATEAEQAARAESLAETSGLLGATGLMRVLSAASGAPGTFRFSLLTGFYSGSGFLCPSCPDGGVGADRRDEVDRVSANLFLSATPAAFIEAYAGIFSHSTSTNLPQPQLKQVVGDWTLGVKVFMPPEKEQILTAGAALDLGFSTGSGQVGLSGIDSVNLGLRALATADLSKPSDGPIPLRGHLNVGYFFDNSAKLVEDFESSPQGSQINRIERFALDINRVDALQIGLGAEGLFDTARPFLEWSIDIPANRQSYLCVRNDTAPGDSCLRDRPQFSTTPSRVTAGVRVMPWNAVPWWLEGMTVTGAMDLATGGASDFLVEVAPEVPWSVWFGIGYAADTRPRVQIQQVALPAPAEEAPDLSVHGMVIEKETNSAIANAQIRFDGRDLTGLISTAEGRFVTGSLEPGLYTLRITAAGYKEGLCNVEVGPAAPAGEAPQEPAAAFSPSVGRGAASSPEGLEAPPGANTVTCELEPVPKVSNINGRVNDATSGDAIGTASVKITDVLGRELELQVDEVGAFRFENVPPGAASITIQADGYLKSVTRLDVEPLQELDQRFPLAPIPAKPTIRVANKRLELAAPITFVEGSSKLSREALFAVQELAPFLQARPELGRIEIQSHTADAGPTASTLSTERANAVRDALILHGVPSARLTARGYGGSDPLRPADSEDARRQNERIVFQLEAAP